VITLHDEMSTTIEIGFLSAETGGLLVAMRNQIERGRANEKMRIA